MKSGERIARGIRRLARKEIDGILERLEGRRPEDRGTSLHEARKSLKKVRAVLRLVRKSFGREPYRRESKGLREVGRALAPQRDAEVLLKTLAGLRGPRVSAAELRALAKLDRALRNRQRRVLAARDEPGRLRPVLKTAQRHAARWPVEELEWRDLCGGLERTYRRGREAFKATGRARSDEGLHEWRKRVKDFSYQLRVLQPGCPKAVAKLAREVKRLGDRLGEDHDLAMLEGAVKSARLDPVETQSLQRRIASRRRHLQAAAFDLGRLTYADKPGRFAAQIRRFWKDCGRA